jgi:hypothetical protein
MSRLHHPNQRGYGAFHRSPEKTSENELINTLQPGEFLLVVPDAEIQEVYERYEPAVNEAISHVSAGLIARVWNYHGRMVYGNNVPVKTAPRYQPRHWLKSL